MSLELATKYLPYVDELFTTESKTNRLTNHDFTFDGAHSVRVRKVSTSAMNDYGRTGPGEGLWSRYGAVKDLDSTTELFTLRKDRSFTFTIDKLDEDETLQTVSAATALARQLREKVVPEIDAWTISQMIANAGTVKESTTALASSDIYKAVLEASNALDAAEVPETGRVLVVVPNTYMLIKTCPSIVLETNIGSEIVRSGVVAMLDGMTVMRIPASRAPEGFNFMVCHPCATVGVQKLASYRTHVDPPGINGSLVEGRIVYDAFVLDNKKKAIYVHTTDTDTEQT